MFPCSVTRECKDPHFSTIKMYLLSSQWSSVQFTCDENCSLKCLHFISGLVTKVLYEFVVRSELLYWTVLRALGIFVCLSGGICVCGCDCQDNFGSQMSFYLHELINKCPKLSCPIKAPASCLMWQISHMLDFLFPCRPCVCVSLLTFHYFAYITSPYQPYCCQQQTVVVKTSRMSFLLLRA